MTARYAIYDPSTNKDIKEVADLAEAYAEIDRMREHHNLTYSVRIASAHRAQVERTSEIREVRKTTLERMARRP